MAGRQFVEVPPRTVNGRYFGGKMIKSPKDQRGSVTNRFLLRRDFTLKAKPVEAVVQFVSDDGAFLHINGKWAARNNTWNKPTVADIKNDSGAPKGKDRFFMRWP